MIEYGWSVRVYPYDEEYFDMRESGENKRLTT